jgi:tRNA (guanine-N7-)-methyltransferase
LNPPLASKEASQEPIRFYGRRKGKPLNAGRVALLETLLPRLKIERPTRRFDPRAFFQTKPSRLWLEIGFGSGEHLAAQASAHPDIGFIGSEVFLNGVAGALKQIDAQKLANVRLFNDDVRFLLPQLPAASLDRVFLLFPDPWPKTRHAKRRFIGPAMLDELARVLADGAELRVATDHPVYARWCLQHAPVHPDFVWIVAGPRDWRERPADGFPTRYEQKAIAAGRPPIYLRFARRPRGSRA